MRTGTRTLKYVVILLIILGLIIIVAASPGAAKLSLKDTGLIMASRIPGINRFINTDLVDYQDIVIISQIRLPRIFLSIFVGMALAGAGVIFQGLFRNPMADPFVIGVSSGAALGATIGLVFITGAGILGDCCPYFFHLEQFQYPGSNSHCPYHHFRIFHERPEYIITRG